MNRRNFIAAMCSTLAASTVVGCRRNYRGGTVAEAGRDLNFDSFSAQRKLAKTPFGRIAYVERGTGPAALFLHGFPLNGFQWRGALDALSAHRRCIAPDFLALGYTEVAEGQEVGPDAQVAMLLSLLDALGVRSVDLVANDSGGAIAQLLIARHPDRVRTLLLTNCDVETDSPPAAMLPVIELSKAGKFADEWLTPWRVDKPLARSMEGIGGMCYADPAHPTDEAIEYYFAPILASDRRKDLVHAYAIALERNALAGIEPALRRSTIPTRVVWGMGDTIFSPDSPDYLHRILGNSLGVRRLQDSKLFWPEERPDIIIEEAKRLWNI